MNDTNLLEAARDAASDLHRWGKAFSDLTGYAGDFEATAQRLDDAIKAEEARRNVVTLADLMLEYGVSRADGWVSRGPGGEGEKIDRECAAEAKCDNCEAVGMRFHAWTKREGYRVGHYVAFGECWRCGHTYAI